MKKANSITYKKCVIYNKPSEAFPEMVQITKTPKAINELLGSKWVTLNKAEIAIDTLLAENLIIYGAASVKKEIESIGLPYIEDVSL